MQLTAILVAVVAAILASAAPVAVANTTGEAPPTKGECPFLYPGKGDAQIAALAACHATAADFERALAAKDGASCFGICRDSAAPGERPSCIAACTAHARDGTGLPFDYEQSPREIPRFKFPVDVTAALDVPTFVAVAALVLGWLFMNAAAAAFWLKKVLYAATGLSLTVFAIVVLVIKIAIGLLPK